MSSGDSIAKRDDWSGYRAPKLICVRTQRSTQGLRYNILRQVATGEILVTVVASHRSRFREACRILDGSTFPVAGVGLHLNVQPEMLSTENQMAWFVRSAGWQLTISNQQWAECSIGVGDFPFYCARRELQSDVLEVSKSFRDYPMIDLYSGVGFFTVGLARCMVGPWNRERCICGAALPNQC